MTLRATAATYHREAETWELHARDYSYRGDCRKHALKWALKKIEREFPGHSEYSAEIKE